MEPLIWSIQKLFEARARYLVKEERTDNENEREKQSEEEKCKKTIFIMAHEHRSLRVEERFFALLKEKGFEVSILPWEAHHPIYRSKSIDIYHISHPAPFDNL